MCRQRCPRKLDIILIESDNSEAAITALSDYILMLNVKILGHRFANQHLQQLQKNPTKLSRGLKDTDSLNRYFSAIQPGILYTQVYTKSKSGYTTENWYTKGIPSHHAL